MNRTVIAIAALLSLGAAAPQALAQAQAQQPPVATPPAPPAAGTSIATRAQISGSITQTTNNPGGSAQGQQTVDIASVAALSGASGQIDTRGSLVGSVTQSRDGGVGSPQAFQAVRLGAVHGFVQAASVRTNGVIQGDVSQRLRSQQAGQGNVSATQTLDVGSVNDASGQSLVTGALVVGNVSQTQDRAIGQEVRVGSIRGATVQDARTAATLGSNVTQTGTAGGGVGPNGSQTLTIAAIDGARAQSVRTDGTQVGALTQTQTGLANQRVDVGSVLGTGVSAPAGSISTFGVVGNVTQATDGHPQQVVAVARVLDSSATNAEANGVVTGGITQTSFGPIAGGNQFIGVGNIEGGRGNVVTDAVVDATLTQVRAGNAGDPVLQTIGIGSARGTTGVVRTRARVTGSVTQIASPGRNIEQQIEIGSVIGTGANVTTNAVFDGNIVQNNPGLLNQRQAIRIGSVSSSN